MTTATTAPSIAPVTPVDTRPEWKALVAHADKVKPLHIRQLFRDDAMRAGIVDYRRSEALNTHPLFIEALADLVSRQLVVA